MKVENSERNNNKKNYSTERTVNVRGASGGHETTEGQVTDDANHTRSMEHFWKRRKYKITVKYRQ